MLEFLSNQHYHYFFFFFFSRRRSTRNKRPLPYSYISLCFGLLISSYWHSVFILNHTNVLFSWSLHPALLSVALFAYLSFCVYVHPTSIFSSIIFRHFLLRVCPSNYHFLQLFLRHFLLRVCPSNFHFLFNYFYDISFCVWVHPTSISSSIIFTFPSACMSIQLPFSLQLFLRHFLLRMGPSNFHFLFN